MSSAEKQCVSLPESGGEEEKRVEVRYGVNYAYRSKLFSTVQFDCEAI